MKNRIVLWTVILTVVVVAPAIAADQITAAQAINFVGQTKTVCGHVASTFYGRNIKGGPTFINLDKAYPNQIFIGLIWQEDRFNFPAPPENEYKDKDICITGVIKNYKGKAEIVIKVPAVITEVQ